MPRVYSSPIGPPTLACWLVARAMEHTESEMNDPAAAIDPGLKVLRDAFLLSLTTQRDMVARHYHICDESDAWDHAYGEGYRSWLASMDAAISQVEDIEEEPRFA